MRAFFAVLLSVFMCAPVDAQSTFGGGSGGGQGSHMGRAGVTGSTIFKHWPPSFGVNNENLHCTGASDSLCWTGNQTDGPANLPQTGIYTGLDGTPSPGSVVVATAGGTGLQTAINNAVCGETIQVPPMNGSAQNVYPPVTLVAHNCDINHWITIETAAISNPAFPLEHNRATPCAINLASVTNYPSYPCPSPAFLMPQIQAKGNSGTAGQPIQTAAGANFYRIIGIELGVPHGIVNDLYLADLSAGTDHIILDRMIMHGEPFACSGGSNGYTYSCTSADQKGGVQTQNGTNVAIMNSWIYDIGCPQGTCTDSIGIGGGNGGQPSHTIKVFNNLIASMGESWIWGGGGLGYNTPTVTPTDIEIRGNHSYKNPAWVLCAKCGGTSYPEWKNLGELKNAQRVVVEGNEFENSWQGWETDQSAYAFLLTPKNQSNYVDVPVTTDSTGTILTATSGTFPSSIVDPHCASANHCALGFASQTPNTLVQSITDPTHIVVSPPVAVSSTGTAKCYTPGLNPTAIVTDVTFRFNEVRNTGNGIQFAAVLSDGNDRSLGIAFVSVHDNLLQGLDAKNDNNVSNGKSSCFQITNGQSAPANVHDYLFTHNTCLTNDAAGFSNSGIDNTLDETDTTTDGSTGSYFANANISNNLGAAGGQITYKQGSLYPGGVTAGLKQQGCTPAVTGTTCTWTYTKNVEAIGLYTNQTNNTPFPSTNQTCGTSGQTCFPSGTSTFEALFQQYLGPNGQPGYLGNYQLVCPGAYCAAGTDGKDIGVSDWTTFANMTAGVRSDAVYTPAAFVTSFFPAATVNSAYTQQISATSAGAFQWITVSSGSLPTGIALKTPGAAGCGTPTWCIAGTPTVVGTYNFTLQLYDAAHQYATQAYTLSVTNPSTGPNWVQVFTQPASCPYPHGLAIRNVAGAGGSANEWYLACHTNAVVLKSSNQGSSWTDITPSVTGTHQFWSVQVNPHNGSLIVQSQGAGSIGSQTFISTDDGNTWTNATPSGWTGVQAGSHSGCALPTATSDVLVCGAYNGTLNEIPWWSTNDGVTASLPTSYTGGSTGSVYGLGVSPFDNSIWLGGEASGTFRSTNGHDWVLVQTCNSCGGTNSDVTAFAFDSAGNAFESAQNGVYKSSGTGNSLTWSRAFPTPGQTNAIFEDPSTGYLYVNVSPNGVNTEYRSIDDGASWQAWDTGLPAGDLASAYLQLNPADGKLYMILFNDPAGSGAVYSSPR